PRFRYACIRLNCWTLQKSRGHRADVCAKPVSAVGRPLRCLERGTLRRDMRPPVRGRTGRASLYGRFPWASPNLGTPTRHRLPVRRISVRGFACDGMRTELPLGASWTVSRRCYFLCHRGDMKITLIPLRCQWTAVADVRYPTLLSAASAEHGGYLAISCRPKPIEHRGR